MDEALAAACGDELEHPVAIAFACCQLFAACGRVRDYEHAFQWCERVADLCERRNIWSVLAATRCSYAQILIARGRYAEAERLLMAAESRYGEKGLARHRALAVAWLAELRFRQGRLAEAGRLVERADPEPVAAGHCRRDRSCAGASRAAAAEHASAYLRQSDPQQVVLRATALELMVRAEVASRRPRQAGEYMDELAALAAQCGRAPIVASALVARAALEAESDDLESARRALADAIDLYEQAKLRTRPRSTRIALARVLAAAGRTEEAARRARPRRGRLRELRAATAAPALLTPREIAVFSSSRRVCRIPRSVAAS